MLDSVYKEQAVGLLLWLGQGQGFLSQAELSSETLGAARMGRFVLRLGFSCWSTSALILSAEFKHRL